MPHRSGVEFLRGQNQYFGLALDLAAMAVPAAGLLWLRHRLEAGLSLAPMEALVDPLLDAKQRCGDGDIVPSI